MSVSCVSAVSGIYEERFYRQSSTFPSQLCAASRFLHTQPVQPVLVGRRVLLVILVKVTAARPVASCCQFPG